MVIDSSALLVIMNGESERERFVEAIASAEHRLVGAPTMLETSIVVLRRSGERKLDDLRDFCAASEVINVVFGPEHLEIAIEAFRQFGKGRHPAALNYGDCFSYALARATGEPLLFKGDDFARTDVERAA